MTRQPTRSPWNGHAAAVLQAAIRRDRAATQTAVTALIAAFGADVLPQVMLAWVDTTLNAQGVTADGRPARIVFGNPATGRVSDADDVPPEIAWAGRLLGARAADDEDTYRALMAAIPDEDVGRHITALLHCCAETCRLGGALKAART